MKKKSRIATRSTKMSDSFGRKISHKTEQSGTAVLMHWMREIIKENNLDLGLPDVETMGGDRKRPDIIINKSRRSLP